MLSLILLLNSILGAQITSVTPTSFARNTYTTTQIYGELDGTLMTVTVAGTGAISITNNNECTVRTAFNETPSSPTAPATLIIQYAPSTPLAVGGTHTCTPVIGGTSVTVTITGRAGKPAPVASDNLGRDRAAMIAAGCSNSDILNYVIPQTCPVGSFSNVAPDARIAPGATGTDSQFGTSLYRISVSGDTHQYSTISPWNSDYTWFSTAGLDISTGGRIVKLSDNSTLYQNEEPLNGAMFSRKTSNVMYRSNSTNIRKSVMTPPTYVTTVIYTPPASRLIHTGGEGDLADGDWYAWLEYTTDNTTNPWYLCAADLSTVGTITPICSTNTLTINPLGAVYHADVYISPEKDINGYYWINTSGQVDLSPNSPRSWFKFKPGVSSTISYEFSGPLIPQLFLRNLTNSGGYNYALSYPNCTATIWPESGYGWCHTYPHQDLTLLEGNLWNFSQQEVRSYPSILLNAGSMNINKSPNMGLNISAPGDGAWTVDVNPAGHFGCSATNGLCVGSSGPQGPNPNYPTITITGISGTTVTTGTNHGLSAGQSAYFVNMGDSGGGCDNLDETSLRVLTVPTATTFTISTACSPAWTASGGVIKNNSWRLASISGTTINFTDEHGIDVGGTFIMSGGTGCTNNMYNVLTAASVPSNTSVTVTGLSCSPGLTANTGSAMDNVAPPGTTRLLNELVVGRLPQVQQHAIAKTNATLFYFSRQSDTVPYWGQPHGAMSRNGCYGVFSSNRSFVNDLGIYIFTTGLCTNNTGPGPQLSSNFAAPDDGVTVIPATTSAEFRVIKSYASSSCAFELSDRQDLGGAGLQSFTLAGGVKYITSNRTSLVANTQYYWRGVCDKKHVATGTFTTSR